MRKRKTRTSPSSNSKKEIEYLIYSGNILLVRLREKENVGCELCTNDNGSTFVKIYANDEWVGTIYPVNKEVLRIKKIETEINLKELDVISSDILNPSIRMEVEKDDK